MEGECSALFERTELGSARTVSRNRILSQPNEEKSENQTWLTVNGVVLENSEFPITACTQLDAIGNSGKEGRRGFKVLSSEVIEVDKDALVFSFAFLFLPGTHGQTH